MTPLDALIFLLAFLAAVISRETLTEIAREFRCRGSIWVPKEKP
jgi:hypothetical protein